MRYFSARETEWLLELDTIELASFSRRAIAFLIDSSLAGLATAFITAVFTWSFFTFLHALGHVVPDAVRIELGKDEGPGHFVKEILVPILYFGLLIWRGKGQSPGKRWMKIRVVSLVHRHLSLWHSIERALGYGAAFLEGGFGFFQFFIHPYRRCVQDRIAETIVVTEASYRAMQFKPEHALLPDDGHQPASRLADETVQPDQISSISSST